MRGRSCNGIRAVGGPVGQRLLGLLTAIHRYSIVVVWGSVAVADVASSGGPVSFGFVRGGLG